MIDFGSKVDEALKLSLILNQEITAFYKAKGAESVSSAELAVALNIIMKAYIQQAPIAIRMELMQAVLRNMMDDVQVLPESPSQH